jgi:hypothetical protein
VSAYLGILRKIGFGNENYLVTMVLMVPVKSISPARNKWYGFMI